MLHLFDLAGIYFRAFHAVPTSTVGPHGRPVNSIRGTLDILARVIAEARPSRAVACLDLDWRPAWRVELIPTYKSHRVAAATADPDTPDVEEAPDELAEQVPVLLEILDAIGLATGSAEHCEADDVIGTLAATERADPVEIVTGDRDLFQLVADGPPPITVRYIGAGMSKAKVYDTAAVEERFGVPATGYVDYATLRGDPSDGLPGVAGIGEKTASALITSYGSITGLLAALDDAESGLASGPRAKLAPARAYLRVAPDVTAVRRDAAVELSRPDALPDAPADGPRLTELAAEHGVGNSVRRLTTVLGFAEDSW
ncbi:MAG: 5'-3' exonuclease [Williamsia herbipolensis]|nr:5'-3' exonuclease [Williamsia herbipolensis]